jgi:hypothetical protein
MPNPRVANCIFCDDVRVEVGGKLSLMGVYNADILFAVAAPAAIPKFGIVVWLIHDIDDKPEKITIRILMPPERNEVVRIEGTLGDQQLPYEPDEMSKGILRFVIPIMSITFSEEGFLEVMIDTGRETLRAGRLRIRFNAKPEEMGGLVPTPG